MTPLWQRRTVAAVIATCLAYMVANLIFDTRSGQGRVILVLSSEHGVHSGDVPVLLAWFIGVVGCAWFALRND